LEVNAIANATPALRILFKGINFNRDPDICPYFSPQRPASAHGKTGRRVRFSPANTEFTAGLQADSAPVKI
jgi:hypothetical protein